jgi:alpha-N-arabinofuranosidase
MSGRVWFLALTLLAAAPFSAPGAGSSWHAEVKVDTQRVIGPVNRLVFGQNIEAADGHHIFGPHPSFKPTGDGFWDPSLAIPVPEVVAASKLLGVSLWRYPGGCLAHGFDWKKTIGPARERPNFVFGLDEFLQMCEATDAVPLITVADYTGTPQDAADLVEYLNAPATPDHPWAMKRAANGRKEPWGVRYFEMGNETDHGNHEMVPRKVWSAPEYVRWFHTCAGLMRAVDPSVQMGALTGTNTGPFDPWNRIVAQGVKDHANFFIIHTYAVRLWSPDKSSGADPDLVTRAAVSSVADFEEELAEYNAVLRAASGRDLPLAITEYNTLMVHPETDPIPFRHTWGTALFCADYIRLLLQPKTNVLMANHWHMLNGYFGFLSGPHDVSKISPEERKWIARPTYEVFRLWAAHTGNEIVQSTVSSPALSFEGFGYTKARGRSSERNLQNPAFSLVQEARDQGITWKADGPAGGTLRLDEQTGERYLTIGNFPVVGGENYRITFESRFEGEAKTLKLGLGLGDLRGFSKTQSAVAIQGLDYADDWQMFTGVLSTLKDATGAEILWRILNAHGTRVTGVAKLRNMRIEAVSPSEKFPAVTALATISSDRRTLFLTLINKNEKEPIRSRIDVSGQNPRSAKIWTVTGPSLSTFETGPQGVKETVSGVELVRIDETSFLCDLPPASMNAVEILLNP